MHGYLASQFQFGIATIYGERNEILEESTGLSLIYRGPPVDFTKGGEIYPDIAEELKDLDIRVLGMCISA